MSATPPPLPTQSPIRRISEFCRNHGLEIYAQDERSIHIIFHAPSGRDHVLTVFSARTAVLLSIDPRQPVAANEYELPASVTAQLMKLNSQFTIGYWCISGTEDEVSYCIRHSMDPSFLTEPYFLQVANHLVRECELFLKEQLGR